MPLVYTGEICQYNLHDESLVYLFIYLYIYMSVSQPPPRSVVCTVISADKYPSY